MNETNVEVSQSISKLASLSDRFFASLIDALIMGTLTFVPLFIIYGFSGLFELRSQNELFYTLITFVAGQLVFLSIQGWLLINYGQTVGKKFMEIKIVDLNGNLPSFGKVYGFRYLSMSIMPLLPGLGGLLSLVDILCIYRKDRRCIHDMIAGTKVISV
jgi:uncharacterized RDD family membrane protein YckC